AVSGRLGQWAEQGLHLCAEDIDKRGAPAAVDAGHHLEQFTGNMVSGTDAGRRHVDLAGIGLGVGNELGNRLDRHRWIRLHNKGLAMRACDRGASPDQMEFTLLLDCSAPPEWPRWNVS